MKKDEEKFIWYKAGNVWIVIIILAIAFINLFLGNPMGR
jgi:hypothetical protein